MCQGAQAEGTSQTKTKPLAPLVKQSSNSFSQLSLPLTHLLGASLGFVTHKLTWTWLPVSHTKAMEGHWLRSSNIDLDGNTKPSASWVQRQEEIWRMGHQTDFYYSLWLNRQFSLFCAVFPLPLFWQQLKELKDHLRLHFSPRFLFHECLHICMHTQEWKSRKGDGLTTRR